jgi:hypothetical protein
MIEAITKLINEAITKLINECNGKLEIYETTEKLIRENVELERKLKEVEIAMDMACSAAQGQCMRPCSQCHWGMVRDTMNRKHIIVLENGKLKLV